MNNQKNSQAVSPLNLLTRGRRNEKITLLFFAKFPLAEKQSFETKFRKLFGKEKTMGNG